MDLPLADRTGKVNTLRALDLFRTEGGKDNKASWDRSSVRNGQVSGGTLFPGFALAAPQVRTREETTARAGGMHPAGKSKEATINRTGKISC